MFLNECDISCGIIQLADIGNNPKQKQFDDLINGAQDDHFGMVIASITEKQKNAVAFLKKNKFRKAGKWKVNPNTGNRIALFVKSIKGKKRRDDDCW